MCRVLQFLYKAEHFLYSIVNVIISNYYYYYKWNVQVTLSQKTVAVALNKEIKWKNKIKIKLKKQLSPFVFSLCRADSDLWW